MLFAYYLFMQFIARINVVFATQTLPTVDLGYETHRAISYDPTTETYNFTNIRYAQPPLGDLRFAAPVPPSGRNPNLQDGSVGAICPQAIPHWQAIAADFAGAWATNKLPFDYDAAAAALSNISSVYPANLADPRISEDCLVLDVIVPRSSFDHSQSGSRKTKKPVLVWIYGGGYAFGTKELYGSPAGLIAASQANDSAGIIYVAMNYRLGAFGFLAGPTFQSDGIANAGLYDQRLALEWVQTHISKFGGDPNQVTIIGESAGGGSVMHQVTAFGGQKPVPFQRAIPQSPALVPLPGIQQQEDTFQQFLSLLNISTLEEARMLPSDKLITANSKQISNAPYATFIYGPAVDGLFSPEIPSKLLLQGSFANNVSILSSHNTNEGVLFVDPRVTNDTAFALFIRSLLGPQIQNSTIHYLVNDLYPPHYDGSQPYNTFLDRFILFLSEGFLSCNARFLAHASGSNLENPTPSYAYEFSVPPALHGGDLAYTFYNGPSSGAPNVDAEVARALQDIVVSFALTGLPKASRAGVTLPPYGTESLLANLNITGVEIMSDPLANPRCAWWQEALFD